jgi:hypothetical protein
MSLPVALLPPSCPYRLLGRTDIKPYRPDWTLCVNHFALHAGQSVTQLLLLWRVCS